MRVFTKRFPFYMRSERIKFNQSRMVDTDVVSIVINGWNEAGFLFSVAKQEKQIRVWVVSKVCVTQNPVQGEEVN